MKAICLGILIATAALCSCSASGPRAMREPQAGALNERFVGTVNAYGGDVSFTQNTIGPPTPHLGPGGWVSYVYASPVENYFNASLQVQPLAPEEGTAAGEYWVGLQDRARGRWQWFGPYSSAQQPTFGRQAEVSVDINWDLLANTNNVTVYCTKPISMGLIDFIFVADWSHGGGKDDIW